ncbi:hypothetical protein ZYGR_0E01550 [Zygosaccharomyces rouxii]|uniref:ZYRO0B03454p n=2 Tax=Zygosaccharomyces rouxii TaxID=4956 RepID=C5DQW1_ZYGRC|nr:uncharacterized protein ZYRO0B03454g [Zygosaccharomyces rouxii]KAH9200279.1 A1 cistron-splicing factor [Zygosaccharomyces rouxii]GAV47140.1 hypothetical protein ZYGR_0E01550 [Zygosaccharomyces rouxii]CAR26172.1 ZYRO0B03454p [Zygosaccharomyces rouxii]
MNAVLYGSNSPIDVVVGIDNFTFELKAGQPFGGIKNISPGIHVLHWGDDSMRYGYWFDVKNQYQIVYRERFELVPNTSIEYQQEVASHLQFMVTYPREGPWGELSRYVSLEQAQMITGDSRAYADSSMTSLEESQMLQRTLSQGSMDIPNSDPVFHFHTIKFKSLEAIREDHKAEDFMDKSYYLNQVLLPEHYGNHFDRLLGELQFAFLNVMVFGNYGSSLQWHSIVELISFSSRVNKDTIRRFDGILSLQIDNLQQEYADFLLNPSVWFRVLNDSHQGHNLSLTRRTFSNRGPDLLEDAGQDANDPDQYSDEYEPTVVGGVYYCRQ